MIKPRKLSKIDLYCEVAGRAKREAQEAEKKRIKDVFFEIESQFYKSCDVVGLSSAADK